MSGIKFAFLFFFFLPGLCCYPAESFASQPNIILVFIDDLGWGDLSCFGNSEAQTPCIDRLAAEGIRFERFYVNSPICSPSRVAVSTGQYPARWNITSYLAGREANSSRGIENWLSPDAPMLSSILQDSGYTTAHFGKWHMGGQRDVGDAPLITGYGFDASLTNFEGLGPRVLGLNDKYDGSAPVPHGLGSAQLGNGQVTWMDRSQITAAYTNAAIEFIQAAGETGKPFYVNLWPDDVHSPFFPPEPMRGDGSKKALYHGVLQTMDAQLGVLFEFIRCNEKLRDNTVILICSDNGPEQGAGSAGPFRGFKTHLFEGGIRSPLIVWGPGIVAAEAAGSVNTASVFSAIDLVPSLIKLGESSPPADVQFDGEQLSEVLTGRSSASRLQPLFFRRPPDRDSFYGVADCPDLAVRHENWKLLCEYDGSDAVLYDLIDDPAEENDISANHPSVVEELKRSVVRWHEQLPQDNGPTLSGDR